MLDFNKSNFCVSLLSILHKIYSKATISTNELKLAPFSCLFDVKCKKRNAKSLCKCILGHLGECVFHIFPRLQSITRVFPDISKDFFGSCYNIQFKSCPTSSDAALCHKNTRNVSNIFELNNKDTWMAIASIVNLKYFALYSTVIIAERKQKKLCRVLTTNQLV